MSLLRSWSLFFGLTYKYFAPTELVPTERTLDQEDFARVHYVGGINRLFNRAHDAYRLTVFGQQEVNLAAADAVLAGTGPVHR